MTAHKIAHSAVAEKPEIALKCLRKLVDLGRIELPTPWLQSAGPNSPNLARTGAKPGESGD